MKILVVNCGSSSIKYQLFDAASTYELLVKGMADRIGLSDSCLYHHPAGKQEQRIERPFPDYRTALKAIFEALTDNKHGVIKHLDEIHAVGHRIVHGGSRLTASVLVDDKVIEQVRENTRFAPLHNPANLAGIEICRELLPGTPNIAVFDTAVHQTMPPKAFLYGLPIELYEKHGIRKYGFQGISHGYVAKEAARVMKKPFETLKIITCHLGNGSSITAFEKGKSIDTSMGLTPLEGVMMATRSGDIDPAIVPYLIELFGLGPKQVRDFLNKESGLQGLCGKSDMRDVMELADNGNPQARTAIEVFVYRVRKYIGAYAAALNGVDAIVFTAGIGQNSPYLREKILAGFDYLGLRIDRTSNQRNQTIFSAGNSKVCAMTIPTDEELVIATETYRIMSERKK
ncbi:MAG TPA: acetate kinase [Sedimentisphaerales bacterium]|nr:acetate kinase [Sedimentisphaerales bacterium]